MQYRLLRDSTACPCNFQRISYSTVDVSRTQMDSLAQCQMAPCPPAQHGRHSGAPEGSWFPHYVCFSLHHHHRRIFFWSAWARRARAEPRPQSGRTIVYLCISHSRHRDSRHRDRCNLAQIMKALKAARSDFLKNVSAMGWDLYNIS